MVKPRHSPVEQPGSARSVRFTLPALLAAMSLVAALLAYARHAGAPGALLLACDCLLLGTLRSGARPTAPYSALVGALVAALMATLVARAQAHGAPWSCLSGAALGGWLSLAALQEPTQQPPKNWEASIWLWAPLLLAAHFAHWSGNL